MLHFLELRDGQRVDSIIVSVRSDEFDEYDAPREIQRDNHPKIATCDFKSRSFPIQNLCIWSSKAHVLH